MGDWISTISSYARKQSLAYMVAKLDAYKGAWACSSDLLCPLATGIVAPVAHVNM